MHDSHDVLTVRPGAAVSDVLVTKPDGTQVIQPAYTSEQVLEIQMAAW